MDVLMSFSNYSYGFHIISIKISHQIKDQEHFKILTIRNIELIQQCLEVSVQCCVSGDEGMCWCNAALSEHWVTGTRQTDSFCLTGKKNMGPVFNTFRDETQ